MASSSKTDAAAIQSLVDSLANASLVDDCDATYETYEKELLFDLPSGGGSAPIHAHNKTVAVGHNVYEASGEDILDVGEGATRTYVDSRQCTAYACGPLLNLWDLTTGQVVNRVDHAVRCLALGGGSQQNALVAGADGDMSVLDVRSADPLVPIKTSLRRRVKTAGHEIVAGATGDVFVLSPAVQGYATAYSISPAGVVTNYSSMVKTPANQLPVATALSHGFGVVLHESQLAVLDVRHRALSEYYSLDIKPAATSMAVTRATASDHLVVWVVRKGAPVLKVSVPMERVHGAPVEAFFEETSIEATSISPVGGADESHACAVTPEGVEHVSAIC